nr:fumagillin dodecapentaenoate synthase [Quercus suber]
MDLSKEPIAIVGFACRLPGGNSNPQKLWDFLERGDVASNKVPETRFNINGHWDGSLKPRTMRPCGGMMLDYIDPADFDAPFFEISRAEAISMDPNQRQMLELVSPLSRLTALKSAVSLAPLLQVNSPTTVIGTGDSNSDQGLIRVIHYSVTIDTACSGSLIGLDVACRYLKTREIDAAIVATSNLYLNPEHVMDTGAVGNAHSPTGLCHTFDASADGYVKAEAVSAIIVKRLSDAIRDRDPVRAIVRGSATNSDGRTPGIASPSAEAQAAAIRAAYRNAGITNLNDTAYLECHGTGTQAGDPMEVGGAGSVFSAGRPTDKPLIIGSIKSNVGHAEPAAGLSGLMKSIMAIEKGIIPGNPTFDHPSPKIDFAGLKVKATRSSIPWPAGTHRRASVNSFGYGGSNCHVVLDQASLTSGPHHVSSLLMDDDFGLDDDDDNDEGGGSNPVSLILSANDELSLKANIKALSSHLMNPRVKVSLADLAYTLSDRRSKHFHRAFITTKTTEIDEKAFVTGKKHAEIPRIGFIFTGQGAQWPQMGRDLLRHFPWTQTILAELDAVLQSLPSPPGWSLSSELVEPRSPEHLRQPEFSQPLVTALQLCFIDVLGSWGIKPHSVVGHSSGEIAAAYAAGLLSKADAIKAAFYRGRAAVNQKHVVESDVGMLAVGLGVEAVMPLLDNYDGSASIACFNSPSSVTVSGKKHALEALKEEISAAGHFARLLQVDLAYHSTFMDLIGQEYEQLLLDSGFDSLPASPDVAMYSSVTGQKKSDEADASYWKTNMVSPVRFDRALTEMLSAPDRPDFLIEIGPSGALAGPTSQIKKALGTGGEDILYCASWARGADAGKAMFDVAGRLFIAGGQVDFNQVNEYDTKSKKPSIIIDLPNYVWNHSTKYWHENQASKDWRFKQHVVHDLLGSKVLGTSWKVPTWRKLLNLSDVPWLKDHKMGPDVVMPGAGYIAMALEAMYQSHKGNNPTITGSVNDFSYRLRNIAFVKALVLEEGKEAVLSLSLSQQAGNNSWYEFRVSSTTDDVFMEHCNGLICIQTAREDIIALESAGPLEYATSGHLWYKAQSAVGYGFGPSFQKLLRVESTSGQRHCRASVNLAEPESRWNPQSSYSIHPASLDGCFQTVTPSLWSGERSSLNAVLVPSVIDDLFINKVPRDLREGISLASSEYTGRGRLEEAKSYLSNCSVYDTNRGRVIMQMTGLRFAKLDTVVKPDPHTFDQIVWKPDVHFLSQDQFTYMSADSPASKIDLVIDLIAHKKPNLQILEISFDVRDTKATWLEDGDRASRAAYLNYHFASTDAKQLVSIQMKHEASRDSSFFLVNQSKEAFGLESTGRDLVIIRVSENMEGEMNRLTDIVRPLLSENGYLIYVQRRQDAPASPLSDTSSPVSESSGLTGELKHDSPSTPESSISDSSRSEQTTGKILESVQSSTSGALQDILNGLVSSKSLQEFAAVKGFGEAHTITDSYTLSAYLIPPRWPASGSKPSARELSVVRLAKESPPLTLFLKTILHNGGWNITEHDVVESSSALGSIVLILDELSTPILAQVTTEQWDTLKGLVASGKKLLWVTKGAQMSITHPDNALAHGLFRVVRMEDAGAQLTCLDVQSSTSPAGSIAISQILNYMDSDTSKRSVETEFAERDGIIHVHRIIPDDAVNAFRRYEREGAPTESRRFHANDAAVSLRAERLGTFQELTWCENSTSEVSVEAGRVEVEIHAAGVNFKVRNGTSLLQITRGEADR